MSLRRVSITDVALGLSELEIRMNQLAADGWRVEAVMPINGPPEGRGLSFSHRDRPGGGRGSCVS